MLDRARVMTRSPAQALALCLLALALVGFVVLPAPALGTPYQVVTNPDSSRTVTWNLSDPTAFVFNNVSLSNGKAVLSRQPTRFAWTGGTDFARNGTLGSNLTSDPNGIELAANLTNLVPDGDFNTAGPWSYQNGSAGEVVANREFGGDVLLGHNSSSTQVVFDSLDSSPLANWRQVSSGSCSIVLANVSGGQKQGLGMYRANISAGPGSCAYVGMQRTSSVNWSADDTLLVWINATFHGGMTFNLSAVSGTTTHWTAPQPVNFGWNEVVVDLMQLGTQRGSLSQMTLQFTPVGTGQFVLFLDNIRVGHRVQFNETATVTQSFGKANATASEPGTAQFSFDLEGVNRTGADFARADVTLVAPSGGRAYRLLDASIGTWSHSSADVSGFISSPGTYGIWLNLTLAANTTYAIDTRIRIDNGELTTQPLTADPTFLFWRSLTATAEYLAAPTATNLSYLIGGGSAWSSILPGESLSRFTSRTIQIRVTLQTSLGYYSPSLDALSVTYDFLGPLAAVGLSPAKPTVAAGGSLQFSATALDSGHHGNQSVFFTWSTDDPGASISLTGLFRAGQPGTWNVTAAAVVPGFRFNATTQVTVLSANSPIGGLLFNPLVIGIAAAVVILGAGYALVSRRLFAIDDVFLVSRDGRLMSHNTRRLLADRDEDMLSGMLTAISAFVRDSWRDENGHLRRFDFGGQRTLIERGEHVFLAAVYSGRVPRWAARDLRAFARDLESRFGPAFAKWDGSPEDLQRLRDVMGRYVSRLRYSRRRVWNGFSS